MVWKPIQSKNDKNSLIIRNFRKRTKNDFNNASLIEKSWLKKIKNITRKEKNINRVAISSPNGDHPKITSSQIMMRSRQVLINSK
jgi:hypothetical protein